MAKRARLITKRTNFFDGQRVTEKDLDVEQIHNSALTSNLVVDFHGSGIVKDSPFEETILLDTRNPGAYGENDSQNLLEAGSYDGTGIALDQQPSDPIRGNRIEFELVDVDLRGRNRTKILVLGRAFDGVNSQGNLVLEVLEFSENGKKVSENFYVSLIALFFNNFSGGTGKTENEASVDSLNLIGETGYLIVREPSPLSIYASSRTAAQIESPNYDLINFITSSESRSITDEIELALGSSNNIDDLYLDLTGKEQVSFEKNGATSISYGQKFLSLTNNLQKVELLLSVERDEDLPSDEQLDWSGDLVVSIHSLITEVSCATDAVPDDLIDFDPEVTPLVEISLSQTDLAALGYVLNEEPQVIGFNFAGTLIADPNLEPSLEKNKYYAILISRRGDNRTGTILLEKGFDKVSRKTDLEIPLSTVESFGKQHSKYFEYDPITKSYINDSQSSLWFAVYTDAVEVTDGTAYTDQGVAVSIPKTIGFVGGTEISYFEKNIPLRTVMEGGANYLIMSQVEQFSEPGIHPRTNNQVFTRILDVPSLTMVNSDELEELSEDTTPLILAKIIDSNTRSAEDLSGEFTLPGLVGVNSIAILDPGSDLLNSNLINRIITPDLGCDCNSSYRITKVDCLNFKAGDLNGDNSLTSSDLDSLLELVGNTINSSATEKAILGGEIEILDFLKSDLNDDGTIDGVDIGLLEDAIDGYINFSVSEETKVIFLRLENILETDDYPTIFTDTANSGATTAASATLTLETSTSNQALTIRPGDVVIIPDDSVDAGEYTVVTKSVAADGVSVTLTLLDEDGESPSFSGSTGFNVTITSGTAVNIYADNPNLTNIPYQSTEYQISFIEAPFEERFIEICDLRRNVGVSFLEEESSDCLCETEDCLPSLDCSPVYKNQTYLPGDLYLPEGNILTSPGVPHPGDFEFVNIKLPLPPGTITGCSLNLYRNFIKSENGTCLTAAGFPAMKYSDGSLVGCQDTGTETDLTRGRVKFSTAVASVFVDSLSDGYTEDGYTEEGIETVSSVEAISENYTEQYFQSFDDWTEDALNDTTITTITHDAGEEEAAIFELTTSGNSGQRFGRLNSPSAAQDFSGDFIVDFRASRVLWPASALTNGSVSAFATITITNDDNSVATLKLGWKVIGGYETKLFYNGVIEDEDSVVLSTFNYEVSAPDSLEDEVDFRLRRVNDVVSAYYIIPDRLTEDSTSFGHYIRLGTNPELQPGEGDAVLSYEISQINSPTSGENFFVRLERVDILSGYSSESSPESFTISKSADEVNRATLTFPFNLPRRTTITSATLRLTADQTGTISDIFQITPLDLLNANNLSHIFNVPVEEDLRMTFTPGNLIEGTTFDIDVTDLYSSLLSETGHISGFIKGLIIEPERETEGSFSFTTAELIVAFEDQTTGVVFKVGVSLDPTTGIVTFNTRNILYDALAESNRTVINFGVYLKKSGFKNADVSLTIDDLTRLGIGTCFEQQLFVEDGQCYYIVGGTNGGNYLEGPFECET